MITHSEKKILPYTPQQLFDLVAKVDDYPSFLPWCLSAHILHKTDTEIMADLEIGYKMFKERFRSKVTLKPFESIDVTYVEGPLQNLGNSWTFTPLENGGTEVLFKVHFEFKNFILQKMMESFFEEAITRMTKAFEARAHSLYGNMHCKAETCT